MYSDVQNPISLSFRFKNQTIINNSCRNTHTSSERINTNLWNRNKKEQFIDNLDTIKINQN